MLTELELQYCNLCFVLFGWSGADSATYVFKVFSQFDWGKVAGQELVLLFQSVILLGKCF